MKLQKPWTIIFLLSLSCYFMDLTMNVVRLLCPHVHMHLQGSLQLEGISNDSLLLREETYDGLRHCRIMHNS